MDWADASDYMTHLHSLKKEASRAIDKAQLLIVPTFDDDLFNAMNEVLSARDRILARERKSSLEVRRAEPVVKNRE